MRVPSGIRLLLVLIVVSFVCVSQFYPCNLVVAWESDAPTEEVKNVTQSELYTTTDGPKDEPESKPNEKRDMLGQPAQYESAPVIDTPQQQSVASESSDGSSSIGTESALVDSNQDQAQAQQPKQVEEQQQQQQQHQPLQQAAPQPPIVLPPSSARSFAVDPSAMSGPHAKLDDLPKIIEGKPASVGMGAPATISQQQQQQTQQQQQGETTLSTARTFDSWTSCVGSSNSKYGTCKNDVECRNNKGIADGTCMGGLGVCCVMALTCGHKTSENNTFFANPDYPEPSWEARLCEVEIKKKSSNILQFMIEFEDFELAPPNHEGECITDVFQVKYASNKPSPYSLLRICGQNTGQHMYLDVSQIDEPLVLSVATSGGGYPRRWSIRIVQMDEKNFLLAPPGCLQYYTDTVGHFRSFNLGKNLKNLYYAICFRIDNGYTGIRFTENFFGMNGPQCRIKPGGRLNATVGAYPHHLVIPPPGYGHPTLGPIAVHKGPMLPHHMHPQHHAGFKHPSHFPGGRFKRLVGETGARTFGPHEKHDHEKHEHDKHKEHEKEKAPKYEPQHYGYGPYQHEEHEYYKHEPKSEYHHGKNEKGMEHYGGTYPPSYQHSNQYGPPQQAYGPQPYGPQQAYGSGYGPHYQQPYYHHKEIDKFGQKYDHLEHKHEKNHHHHGKEEKSSGGSWWPSWGKKDDDKDGKKEKYWQHHEAMFPMMHMREMPHCEPRFCGLNDIITFPPSGGSISEMCGNRFNRGHGPKIISGTPLVVYVSNKGQLRGSGFDMNYEQIFHIPKPY